MISQLKKFGFNYLSSNVNEKNQAVLVSGNNVVSCLLTSSEISPTSECFSAKGVSFLAWSPRVISESLIATVNTSNELSVWDISQRSSNIFPRLSISLDTEIRIISIDWLNCALPAIIIFHRMGMIRVELPRRIKAMVQHPVMFPTAIKQACVSRVSKACFLIDSSFNVIYIRDPFRLKEVERSKIRSYGSDSSLFNGAGSSFVG